MKKGLTLAMLMAMMVAFTLPAGAIAPTVSAMNGLVLGDLGASSTTSTLLVYPDAVDLDEKILWNNPSMGASDFHVYLAVDAAADADIVGANASGAVKEVIAWADIATLVSAGTAPSNETAADLAGASLSVLDNTSNTITDVSALTVDDGATDIPDGYSETVQMALVASVTSGSAGARMASDGSWTDFLVYSIKGTASEATSSTASVVVASTAPATDGWSYGNASGRAGILDTGDRHDTYSSGGSMGYTVTGDPGAGELIFQNTTVMDGGSMFPITYAMPGELFTATLGVSSSATTAAACPSVRLVYLNGAFTHLGGTQVTSSADTLSLPSTAGAKEIIVAWTPPSNCTEMGDDGTIAANSFGSFAADGRDYAMQFDLLIYSGDTNSGNILADSLDVTREPVPGVSTSGGKNYSDFSTGWVVDSSKPNAGALATDAFLEAAGIRMRTVTTPTTGLRQTACNVDVTTEIGNCMAISASQLIRCRVTAASETVVSSPNMHVLLLSASTDVAGWLSDFLWGESYGPIGIDIVKTITGAGVGELNPGVAPDTAVSLDVYLWTHTPITNSVLVPQIVVHNDSSHSASGGWDDEIGFMNITEIDLAVTE